MSDDDSDGMGGMTFTDSLEFWGLEVPPNKNMTVQFDPQDDEELIHITQVALGDKPTDEPAAVALTVKGKETFIGTLRKGKCDQFSLDLALGETFSVKHTGKSTVYLTGWRQVLAPMDDDEEEDEDGEEEDDEEEEEEEEEEDEPPVKAKPSAAKPAARPAGKADAAAHKAAPAGAPKQPAKPAPAARPKQPVPVPQSDDDDDDDELDDDDDDGFDDDDDESDEDVPAAPPSKSAAATPGKRAAQEALLSPVAKKPAATPAKTPAAKTPGGGATPGGMKTPAAGKTPATPAADKGVVTPGSTAEFEAQLVSFLKANGRTGLSALGGKIKKPTGVTKLATYLKERPAVFKITGDQVELAKK